MDTLHMSPDSKNLASKIKTVVTQKKNGPSEKLAKLGLVSPISFALHMPLRYEDETKIYSIFDALHEAINCHEALQIQARVVCTSWAKVGGRQQLIVEVNDGTGTVFLRFINAYPAQVKQFNQDSLWRIRGELKHGMYGWEMIHPICKAPNTPLPKNLTAIYPSIAGLPQGYLQACMQTQVKVFTSHIEETIPAALLQNQLKNLALMPFAEALHTIHFPTHIENADDLVQRNHPAWQRIKFDELLAQQLSLKKIYAEIQKHQSYILNAENNTILQQFFAQLPFELTHGQQAAWQEISHDLSQNKPMQRLLQGDVGSGKTIVAALAIAQTVGNGHQVAMMAPTEILAQQLYEKIHQWLSPFNINVELLISAVTAKNKKTIKQNVQNGEIHVLIGTNAIIQKDVYFKKLGLVIIDEQHRFGVAQRLALRHLNFSNIPTEINTNKEEQNDDLPHQLMMSATPIPRSLAMSYYANLDISIMRGLPQGRLPINTTLIELNRREDVIQRLVSNVTQGRQIYWVCPLIEESETLDLQNAQATFELLCQSLPNNIRISLLHGKLAPKVKQQIMQDFKAHIIDILVSTTVIEVGVDVPNASLMIIEHAERFGLAQLHQLRGRVGRGQTQSVCALLYQKPLSYTAQQRLATMRATQDGFEIAQKDLEIRGAGELMGERQSGNALRFADAQQDILLLEYAQSIADTMLKNYPEYVDKHLKLWIQDKMQYIFA
jgi:ATP-dependent DNA helicase RecG